MRMDKRRAARVGPAALRAVCLCLLLAGASVQPTAATAQTPAREASYFLKGSVSDADIERLVATLKKIDGVEQVATSRIPTGVVLRVRGVVSAVVPVTAMRAGFDLRQMSDRTYVVTGPVQDTDLARLREIVAPIPGVEQVQTSRRDDGALLRVRGIVEAPDLAAAAKSAGFSLRMVGAFVVTGSSAEGKLSGLRDSLKRVDGVESVEMRPLVGGAAVLIRGNASGEALDTVATTAGYLLTPFSDPTPRGRRFRVRGADGPSGEETLRKSLQGVPEIGEIQIRTTPEGMGLGIQGGSASPAAIVAAAKAVGIELVTVETIPLPTIEVDGERNTPSDFRERNSGGVTPRVGEMAPDFTLVTKDGKGKVTLSKHFGKRPVVLIFGSYT